MRRASATCSGTSPSSSHSSAWARHLSLATGVWEARYSNSRRCRGESMSGAIGSPSGEATVSDGHCNCAKTYGDLLKQLESGDGQHYAMLGGKPRDGIPDRLLTRRLCEDHTI